MYQHHFGLRELPFGITPDTSFFFRELDLTTGFEYLAGGGKKRRRIHQNDWRSRNWEDPAVPKIHGNARRFVRHRIYSQSQSRAAHIDVGDGGRVGSRA